MFWQIEIIDSVLPNINAGASGPVRNPLKDVAAVSDISANSQNSEPNQPLLHSLPMGPYSGALTFVNCAGVLLWD
jgi:hypothetical protein